MSNVTTPVSQALEALNIPYRLFQHPGPVSSLEQAAEERQQQPEQVIRSIVFRLAKNEYVMVLMAGPQQISWTALRQYIGRSRLTMAKPEEVRHVTGYELGAVAPFGLPQPMRILADESVFALDEISLGSGVRGTTLIMKSSDLRRALGDVEIVQFGGEEG
jgi:Cys-tRNA(Pro) deacylase